MSTTEERRATNASSIAEAFRITASERPDQIFLRTKEDEVSLTFAQSLERVDAIAGGLAGLGLTKGDTCALLIGNRPEFALCDLAVTMTGGVPFSIYMQYTPEQIQFVVSDAGAKILICEQQFLAGVLEARKELPDLAHVIVIDGEAPEGVTPLAEIEEAQSDFDVEASVAALGPEDVLTLIYTSGTTGPPKGVQLCHRNLLSAVQAVEQTVQFPDAARVISWLPSAHIAERAAHHYLPIVYGMTVTSCPNAKEVLSYVAAVKPSWFFAVPRIWEKLKSGLEAMISGKEDDEREQAEGAIAAAIQKVRLEQAGEEVPAELAAAVAKADEALFSKLRAQLGFDQIEAVNVGAAPTPPEVLEFFHAIGIPVAELWGMSETCGAGCVNPPDKIKIGTVGPPSPGVEVKLAEDGELLMKSDVVMLGYRNLPEKTAEAIDEDGWLHTGDIATIDEDGYVTLVDRKKEIIINAAGKNMSPANIEATVKSSSPLIGQACVIGDRRSYNTALIVLDADFAPAYAAKAGIQDASLEALAENEQVRAVVQKGIDDGNEKLARVEQIKKFEIVSGDWLPGGDELTPTMKLKRKPIAEKYKDAIEAMYAG
ncbi:MAG: long-chain fatty acid--CoA ligase [Solirubrobacterales bacterium]|nr:long-chain fatty acid--CoA ligase [Solirubrobacterales bacterium]